MLILTILAGLLVASAIWIFIVIADLVIVERVHATNERVGFLSWLVIGIYAGLVTYGAAVV